jgi:transcriptional regulator with XRE-family HTH domain
MKLGEAIKELRKAKGLKQKDLALKTGVSANAVCKIEKGEAMPQKETLNKILEVLEIPESYLLFFALESTDIPLEKRQVFDQLHETLKSILKA